MRQETRQSHFGYRLWWGRWLRKLWEWWKRQQRDNTLIVDLAVVSRALVVLSLRLFRLWLLNEHDLIQELRSMGRVWKQLVHGGLGRRLRITIMIVGSARIIQGIFQALAVGDNVSNVSLAEGARATRGCFSYEV